MTDEQLDAFFASHAQTGEPSAEQLARVGARLVKTKKKTRLPQEWLAAAAVVLVLLGVQVVRFVRHEAPARGDAVAAYRSKGVEEARRFASERELQELMTLMNLAQHIDSLNEDELAQLEALDAKWSGGEDAEMRQRIDTRKQVLLPVEPSDAEALSAQGNAARGERKYALAMHAFERCLNAQPGNLKCLRSLASVQALVSGYEGLPDMMEKARRNYERYVELAPADDPYLPRIRDILRQAAPTVDGRIRLTLKLGQTGRVRLADDAVIREFGVENDAVTSVRKLDAQTLEVAATAVGETTVLVWLTEQKEQAIDVTVVP